MVMGQEGFELRSSKLSFLETKGTVLSIPLPLTVIGC